MIWSSPRNVRLLDTYWLLRLPSIEAVADLVMITSNGAWRSCKQMIIGDILGSFLYGGHITNDRVKIRSQNSGRDINRVEAPPGGKFDFRVVMVA